MSFTLHQQLEADTLPAGDIGFCALRLMKDQRFPWLVMVPRLARARELFDLSTAQQHRLMEDMTRVSETLQRLTGCDKINVAAFGNMVPQLHIHVIARFETDPAWPGSAIGFSKAEAYAADDAERLIAEIRDELRRAVKPASTPQALF